MSARTLLSPPRREDPRQTPALDLVPDREASRAALTCLAFTPWRSGSMIGRADFHLPRQKLKLLGLPVHERGGRRWVNLPSAPLLDDEGRIRRDDKGQKLYVPCMQWDSAALGRLFSDCAVEALQNYDSSIFSHDQGDVS